MNRLLPWLLAAAIVALLACTAFAHDVYSNVYENNAPPSEPQRRLCCGGDPERGDCEALNYDDTVPVEGGLLILSKRYKAQVFVPNGRITWDVPRDGTSGQPADMHNTFPVHWCGKPRPGGWAPDERNPDPNWVTFCIFVAPGGV